MNKLYRRIECVRNTWSSSTALFHLIGSTPDRGSIVIANKPYKSGCIIFKESPLLRLKPDSELTEIQQELQKLTEEQKDQIWQLHARNSNQFKPEIINQNDVTDDERANERTESRLQDIVDTNGMQIADKKGQTQVYIFIETSRLNHSCAPNAFCTVNQEPELMLRAAKDIDEHHEITISYCDVTGMTRDRRARELQDRFGFSCHCPSCDASEKRVREEDEARSRYAHAISDLNSSKWRGVDVQQELQQMELWPDIFPAFVRLDFVSRAFSRQWREENGAKRAQLAPIWNQLHSQVMSNINCN